MSFILACFLLLGSVKTLYLSPCGQARPGQHWRRHDDGTVRPAADDSRCLTAVVLRGHYGASVQDKNLIVAADCRNDSTAFVQAWKYSNTTSLLALANDTTFVLQADSFTTGAQISFRKCDSKCVSLSRWNYTRNETFETHDNFCLVAGRVSLDVQLSAIYAAPILNLGIPSFWWDQTCIHGVAAIPCRPRVLFLVGVQTRLASYVTILPHAIAQAASLDVPLARHIASIESRSIGFRILVRYRKLLIRGKCGMHLGGAEFFSTLVTSKQTSLQTKSLYKQTYKITVIPSHSYPNDLFFLCNIIGITNSFGNQTPMCVRVILARIQVKVIHLLR